MRIEVTVGSNEPTIYPLSLPKITVGSSDSCEIVINTNGISRKHITIVTENDSFFIIDQGSTNGSFINEERLVPGKKTEFTSFFPVRLGDEVTISLLSEEEKRDRILVPLREKPEVSRSDISRPDITSTSINRKMLRQDKTGTHTNLKIPRPTGKAKSEVSGNVVARAKKINVIPLAAFGILAFAVYWNLFVLEKEPNPDDLANAPVEEFKIAKAPPAEAVVTNHVPKDELLPRDGFAKYQGDIKCVSDVELYFCNLIPSLKVAPYGAVQSKLNVYLMLDGTPYFEEAKRTTDPFAPLVTPGLTNGTAPTTQVSSNEKETYTETHYNLGVYLFLLKHLPELDESKTQDLNILIAFYSKSSPHTPVKVIAFTSKGFNKLKPTLKDDQLIQIRSGGDAAMAPLKEAIEIY